MTRAALKTAKPKPAEKREPYPLCKFKDPKTGLPCRRILNHLGAHKI
jgi:hypothetical protein